MAEEVPNKYHNGKIYKVVDNGYNMCYYGSTTQSLSSRLSGHKRNYNQYKEGKKHMITVFKIFDEYGPDNCKIELVELCPCNSKEELLKKEGHHIKENECINKVISGRTNVEYYKDNKDVITQKAVEYYHENKDKVREKHKAYREKHREALNEKHRTYYEENKERLNEAHKSYYNEHKDSLREKAHEYYNKHKEHAIQQKAQRYTCEACGLCLRVGDRAKHIKTKRHLRNSENI